LFGSEETHSRVLGNVEGVSVQAAQVVLVLQTQIEVIISGSGGSFAIVGAVFMGEFVVVEDEACDERVRCSTNTGVRSYASCVCVREREMNRSLAALTVACF
jgi:hypothetical protein